MDFKNIPNRLSEQFAILMRLLRDTSGSFLLRQWKQTERENTTSVEQSMLPEILRIQAEGFEKENKAKLATYSKRLRKIFYVILFEGKVVGYCIYYLKPALSFKGFQKKAVICAITTDKNYRGRGFAEKLLRESIEEMKLNGISSILLYVNTSNHPAIRLYKKLGFQKTKELRNICGYRELCYEMELKLI